MCHCDYPIAVCARNKTPILVCLWWAGDCDSVSLSPSPALICVCSPLWETNKVRMNSLLLCCFLSLSSGRVEKIHEDSGTKDWRGGVCQGCGSWGFVAPMCCPEPLECLQLGHGTGYWASLRASKKGKGYFEDTPGL